MGGKPKRTTKYVGVRLDSKKIERLKEAGTVSAQIDRAVTMYLNEMGDIRSMKMRLLELKDQLFELERERAHLDEQIIDKKGDINHQEKRLAVYESQISIDPRETLFAKLHQRDEDSKARILQPLSVAAHTEWLNGWPELWKNAGFADPREAVQAYLESKVRITK